MVALDQFFLNESNINNSIIFAASAGAGVYAGMMVGSSLPDLSESLPVFLGNGKGLMQRVAEVGFGTGIGFAVYKIVFKNTGYD